MLVKRKEGVNDGANETKSVKEAKRDEIKQIIGLDGISIKLKVKKRKVVTWKKLTWKKYILDFYRRNRVRALSAKNPLPLLFPPIPLN